MSYYRQQLEQWLSELEVEADTVYDIGGGQGSVEPRVKKWNVKNYKVLDLPEWDLNVNWGDSGNKKAYDLDRADVIFCLEVFEYLIDPKTAIFNISLLLKKGGKAYISVPLIYPTHNEIEFDSLRYTENGFRRLADSVKLEVRNTWYRKDKSGLLQAFYATDGMRAVKGYDHSNCGFIFDLVKV